MNCSTRRGPPTSNLSPTSHKNSTRTGETPTLAGGRGQSHRHNVAAKRRFALSTMTAGDTRNALANTTRRVFFRCPSRSEASCYPARLYRALHRIYKRNVTNSAVFPARRAKQEESVSPSSARSHAIILPDFSTPLRPLSLAPKPPSYQPQRWRPFWCSTHAAMVSLLASSGMSAWRLRWQDLPSRTTPTAIRRSGGIFPARKAWPKSLTPT